MLDLEPLVYKLVRYVRPKLSLRLRKDRKGSSPGESHHTRQGELFITLEDESGFINLVVWSQVFKRHRRIVMSASMLGIHGHVQRESEVMHFVAQRLTDLLGELASAGNRDLAFPLPHGRGDQVRHGGGPDSREPAPKDVRTRDIYVPDPHIDTIKVKPRDFRRD